MRLRRSLCCAFATISCSVFGAVSAAQAANPTVAGELKRLAAEGTIAPEIAAAHRATYDDARAKVKTYTGARKVELGGVIRDLDGMAERGSVSLYAAR